MGFLQRGFALGNRRGFAVWAVRAACTFTISMICQLLGGGAPVARAESVLTTSVELSVTEEYTEEQTQHDGEPHISGDEKPRRGQRLTIPNRTVTKLAFLLRREGAISGNVTFAIRKVSDDSIIISKVWGDAGGLDPATVQWEEVTFDDPVAIDEEVRLSCEYSGGGFPYRVEYAIQNSNVKENERYCWWVGSWTGTDTKDGTYRYKY